MTNSDGAEEVQETRWAKVDGAKDKLEEHLARNSQTLPVAL